MHVSHLSLLDFRSYAAAEVPLEPGVTAFVGPNGQGKTNLVEAVDYVANLRSHRVSGDQPLVRMGAERAIVRVAAVRDDRQALAELEITPGKANRARLNRSPLPRTRELLGLVRTVLFSPDDQALYVCGFLTGEIWAIDRDGAGGWQEKRLLHHMEGALLDGLNVDACGNVYVTEYSAGIVWRLHPDAPADVQLVAQLPSIWIPNLHWGRGIGGFEADVLYVADRNKAALVALPVGVGSTPQAFVPGG